MVKKITNKLFLSSVFCLFLLMVLIISSFTIGFANSGEKFRTEIVITKANTSDSKFKPYWLMRDFIVSTFQCAINIECAVPSLFNWVKSDIVSFSAFVIIPVIIIIISLFNKRFWVVFSSFLAHFFPLLLAFFVFLADAHERRIDRTSNAFAQAESFLREQYPNQEIIEKYKNEPYYGSTIKLKEALEFLHKNGREFTFLYLPKTDLRSVKLSGVALWDANFTDASFENANLNRADLYKVKFNGATLYKANLSGADLFEAEFKEADMQGSKLKGAVITSTDFTDARNLTKKQILQTCWLRGGAYEINGEEIMIKATPPTLPDYLEGFNVHSLPYAKLADKKGEIAYCS